MYNIRALIVYAKSCKIKGGRYNSIMYNVDKNEMPSTEIRLASNLRIGVKDPLSEPYVHKVHIQRILAKKSSKSFVEIPSNPKTPEQLKLINVIGRLVREKVKGLGFEPNNILDANSIDFIDTLPNRSIRNEVEVEVLGKYKIAENRILIFNKLSQQQAISTLTHELIHSLSNTYFISNLPQDQISLRNGYYIDHPTNTTAPEGFFSIMNELTTEIAEGMFIQESVSDLSRDFELTQEERSQLEQFRSYHSVLGYLMKEIKKEICYTKGINNQEVNSMFIKGLFDKSFCSKTLATIQEVFGKEGLEILAYWGSFNSDENDFPNKAILDYFLTHAYDLRRKKGIRILDQIPPELRRAYQLIAGNNLIIFTREELTRTK